MTTQPTATTMPDPVWIRAVSAALASLSVDPDRELAAVPSFQSLSRLAGATALGQYDARVLHRAWIRYAVKPLTIDGQAEKIARLAGHCQVFADDAAFPGHYITFSNRGNYHLVPRLHLGDGRPIPVHLQGVGIGGWAARVPTTEEHVGAHLWPVPTVIADIIALVAQINLPPVVGPLTQTPRSAP